MKASEILEMSIANAKTEIESIEATIVKAAKQGSLKCTVENISDAARRYFLNNGFAVRLTIPQMDIVPASDNKEPLPKLWSISWDEINKSEKLR
jgi:hypothetical protein